MQFLMHENEYHTSDFNEAAVLRYFNHKLLHVDKRMPRAVFAFEIKPDTEQLVRDYRVRELLVEPYAFYQCEREIKSRLYND